MLIFRKELTKYIIIAAMKASPIPEEFKPLKLPVQLLSEQIANVNVVALTTVLLGKPDDVF